VLSLGIRGRRNAARKHSVREVRDSDDYRIWRLAAVSSNNGTSNLKAMQQRCNCFDLVGEVAELNYPGGREQ
jgi:hypothetical protein